MDEQHPELRRTEVGQFGAAAAAERKALRKRVAVERRQHFAALPVDDLEALQRGLAAGDVAEPQLVDQVAVLVGARHGLRGGKHIGDDRRQRGLCPCGAEA